MSQVTLQVLDGVDRGKVFPNLPTPVTIGREEGNAIQLNDERISRYHAKIQEDQGQLVLTDLDSTNGTRVNGEPVALSILHVGDRIALGRSLLLFGSPEELDRLIPQGPPDAASGAQKSEKTHNLSFDKTRPAMAATDFLAVEAMGSEELGFELNFHHHGAGVPPNSSEAGSNEATPRASPDLPVRLTPAQAAQLSELLRYLHQRIATAIESGVQNTEDGGALLSRAAWQRILRVQMELARYQYLIGHPE